MTILVTGAAGFIGSALANKLSNLGAEVVGVDNYSPYYSRDLKEKRVDNFFDSSRMKFVTLDLVDRKNLEKIFSEHRIETVIHLAAQAGVRVSVSNWSRYVEDNLLGFANILLLSEKCKVKSFLYASSSSVYGNQSGKFTEELNSTVPISFYGATKLANENLARTLSSQSQLRTRGLRFFTVYGPWGRPDMVYFKMLRSAFLGDPFILWGDGKIERDFTFINDVIEMVIDLTRELEHRESGYSDVVNIGGGRPISIIELMKTIEAITGNKVPFILGDSDPRDVQNTRADYEKLKRLVGKIPSTPIELGLRSTIEWASRMENKDQLSSWINSVV